MLKICVRYKDLDVHELLSVYEESLQMKEAHNALTAFQIENDFCSYLEDDFFTIAGAFYALWIREGHYVSALRMEPYNDGLIITGLETLPSCRRRGYAYQLLQAVKEYVMRTNHKPIYSHIDKRNTASLSLHHKCGFMQIHDFGRLIDGTVSNNYCTLMLT